MTFISDLIAAGFTISFEFFPPRTAEGVAQLELTMSELAVASPSFVSVTYGAGGSTRDLTRDLVVEVNRSSGFPAMPHLTCMGHTRAELSAMLDDYAGAGVRNILALAGDPPADGSPAGGDFRFASELVDLVRSRGEFSVAVAAFPEGHPRAVTIADDRRHLAAKLEAADFGITQFFYSSDDYFRMVDDLGALGCHKPVIPGVMPMLNPSVIRRFATMNGAWFPEDLAARVESAAPDDRLRIAVDATVELAGELLERGVPGLHIYGLNRSAAALATLQGVGLIDGADGATPATFQGI